MNGKKAKALRKKAKASNLTPDTSYEYMFGAQYIGVGPLKVQSPIVVSNNCVRGVYKKLKRNR